MKSVFYMTNLWICPHQQHDDFFQKMSTYRDIGIERRTETVSGTGKAKRLLGLAVYFSCAFPIFSILVNGTPKLT